MPQEEATLTAVIRKHDPDYLPVYLLALHTGMHLSEQLRAKVGDFEPTTGMPEIHQKKVRNAPATRYVPLTPIGIDANNCLAAGRKPATLLCLNQGGDPLTKARYWYEPVLAEAKIDGWPWHCCRHTFASRLAMNGCPLAVLSKYLGHSTMNQTMEYSYLQPENAAQAVAALMKAYAAPTGTTTGTSTI